MTPKPALPTCSRNPLPTSPRSPHVLIDESTADHHRSGGHRRIPCRRRGSARARDIFVDHQSVRTLPRAVRRGRSGPPASALPELPPGRRAADAAQRQSSAFPAGGPRPRRQGRHRLALHDLPPECELRALARSRASAVACRAEVDGMADEIAGSDLRADQGSAAQRRQDARGDPRAHGARLAGRLGVDARRKPRARAWHAGAARRVDRRVDRVRRRLPRILTTDAAFAASLLERGAFMSITLNINGTRREFDGDPETPLLWVIREDVGLTGTKDGGGIAQCGACTVHVDGQTLRSCSAPVSAVANRQVTTIEGLSSRAAKAVQKAWVELDVVQCGYCQSGQIMSATALLEKNPKPSDTDIDHAMAGNICRCATYQRIRAAIHAASTQLAG